jgi:hypothetical protein
MVKWLAALGLILCAGVIVALSGCTRTEHGSEVASGTAASSAPAASVAPTAGPAQVWISRPDGAQSCTPGSGTSLEDGAAELRKARVRVLGSRKGDDGKMHAQMCGIPTGTSNAYLIPKDDLSAAVAHGYVAVGK